MADARSTWRRRLAGWLICSVVYVAGTYGLGWLIGHPFSFVPWAAGTACILAGSVGGRWLWPRLFRRIAPVAKTDADPHH
jgi:hypothetical protein